MSDGGTSGRKLCKEGMIFLSLTFAWSCLKMKQSVKSDAQRLGLQ